MECRIDRIKEFWLDAAKRGDNLYLLELFCNFLGNFSDNNSDCFSVHTPLYPQNLTLLSICDSDGDSAIHWASYNGHSNTVRLLLILGALPNRPDAAGLRPLHQATLGGNFDCVRELTRRAFVPNDDRPNTTDDESQSTNLNARDRLGRSPRDVAREIGAHKIEEYLLAMDKELSVGRPLFMCFANVARKINLPFFVLIILTWLIGYPLYYLKVSIVSFNSVNPIFQ